MKVWFDILTPKQVMFFSPAVDSLKNLGHDVICTTREYREVTELARIKKLDVKIVGRHGGSIRSEKLIESTRRAFELSNIISNVGPDVAVSFSSPEASRVAFGLGVKHLGFNDSPHAQAVARLTIPLMNKLLFPWVIPFSAWTHYGIDRKHLRRYRALDPAAWLKRLDVSELRPSSFHDGSRRANILIRVEESKASYIVDRKLNRASLLDEIVRDLASTANLKILARYEDQIAEIDQRYGGKVEVIKEVVDGTSLLTSTDLFIGAGGTMTAEAALLGLPTISIAPMLYYTDKFLLKKGLIRRATRSEQVINYVKQFMSDAKMYSMNRIKANRILQSMEDPIKVMISEVIGK